MARFNRTLAGAALAAGAMLVLSACGVLYPPPSTGTGGDGTYTVATITVPSSAGFGGGVIYYPTNASGKRGLISLAPGFTEDASTLKDWGPTLASNGFVTIIINNSGWFNLPGQRSTEQRQALDYVVKQSQTSGNVLNGKVDASRKAVGGHSMGGGGTLESVVADPTLKAAVAFAPWNNNTDFSKDTVPSLIWGCQQDSVAVEPSHAVPMYTSIPSTTKKMYNSIAGGDHFCANSSGAGGGLVGTTTVAFLKLFIDGDTASKDKLCGASKPVEGTIFNEVNSSCPF